MLTCIACDKHLSAAVPPDPDDDDVSATPNTRQALRSLTSQIKDMALKASGAYRNCSTPCSGSNSKHQHHHLRFGDIDSAISGSNRFQYAYKRAGDSRTSTPRLGFSSGDGTPISAIEDGKEEDEELKEWVAQVEPGVLITFISVPEGGNDLKRIRFSREMFNKWQAQRWWVENYEKVTELYNVQKFNRLAVPLPTPLRSEDESPKMESAEGSPVTPPLSKERLPRNFQRPLPSKIGRHFDESGCLASAPKLSSNSGARTEMSSVDAASMRTSSEMDRSGELSVSAASNASDQETEWVEQDEPGVYITIRILPGGIRELRRVRFSRERFGEMHARFWWEENRARIQEQYL